jgi:hypothetical protein
MWDEPYLPDRAIPAGPSYARGAGILRADFESNLYLAHYCA